MEGASPAVAHVVVDLDVPHLDHPFEYSIPEDLRKQVRVGSRVQVRFAGRRKTGWVTSLASQQVSGKRLLPILRVIGPIPLLTRGILKTAEYLAARYATNLKQILAFALPTRSAHVDKEFQGKEVAESPQGVPSRAVASLYPRQMRDALVAAIRDLEGSPRAVVVLPTAAGAAMVRAWLEEAFPDLRVAQSTTEDTAAHRYRTHLAALCGEVDVVVGTRGSVWTPLPTGGTLILWDSGDTRLREVRSPHLDALDVAVARSHVEGVSLLSLGYARSVKDQLLVNSKWAEDTSPPREENLALLPKLRVFDWQESERVGAAGAGLLPQAAYDVIRRGLETGPVLVQVPGPGYRTEFTCPSCEGKRDAPNGACPDSFHAEPVRYRVGSDRLAEELAKAFPRVSVEVSSSTAGIKPAVEGGPRIVVATASAEPQPQEGYGAVVIAGAHALAYQDFLDAMVQAERRWMDALALSAPGAPAMLIASPPKVLEQSLVRWDPRLLANYELEVRGQLGFPPVAWVVVLTASKQTLEACLSRIASPQLVVMSPPHPVGEEGKSRAVVRVSTPHAPGRMRALRAFQVELSKDGRPLLVIDVNPGDLVAG